MKTVQRDGKSVEEIIAGYQHENELTKEQLKYEIIDMGSSGFLGLGRRKARVKFFLEDELDQVKEIAKDLLQHLQIYFVEVEVREKRDAFYLDISFDKDNVAIKEPDEELMFAMEHIVGRIVQEKVNPKKSTYIDINQLRRKKEKHLMEKARSLASKVVREKREMRLRPMYPHDRRIIHLALNKNNEVRTYTVGNGDKKSVVISLKGGGTTNNAANPRHGRSSQRRYPKRTQQQKS